jgi:hypothetical protein
MDCRADTSEGNALCTSPWREQDFDKASNSQYEY